MTLGNLYFLLYDLQSYCFFNISNPFLSKFWRYFKCAIKVRYWVVSSSLLMTTSNLNPDLHNFRSFYVYMIMLSNIVRLLLVFVIYYKDVKSGRMQLYINDSR